MTREKRVPHQTSEKEWGGGMGQKAIYAQDRRQVNGPTWSTVISSKRCGGTVSWQRRKAVGTFLDEKDNPGSVGGDSLPKR